jgi:D-glycero-alpha-D-manno-heptose-7-phosphate kinase
MIISRTPLRISFAGGGSDLRAYYQHRPGAVVSTAIDKYIYITVNKKFDDRLRIGYSKIEIVNNIEDIEHNLVREAIGKGFSIFFSNNISCFPVTSVFIEIRD